MAGKYGVYQFIGERKVKTIVPRIIEIDPDRMRDNCPVARFS